MISQLLFPVQGEGMRAAEMLVWMGDFNYRIVGERDAVVSSIRRFLLRDDVSALRDLLAQVHTCSNTSHHPLHSFESPTMSAICRFLLRDDVAAPKALLAQVQLLNSNAFRACAIVCT